jgi:3-oxo-5alpha-steroid 4-dehydrogenase
MSHSTSALVMPCIEVGSAHEVNWSGGADVVVLGWGAAGACAAIEARAQGASVLVVDRIEGGGASALSGGVVYAGGGTAQQREAGFADTPQAMFDYLRHEVQGAVSDATLRRFCDASVEQLSWLQAQGAGFGATLSKIKTSYPANDVYLYFSGNELVPAYAGERAPAPRGHRTVAQGQAGATLYAALQAATLRAGAQTALQASARRLVRDGQGRVVGVELWQLPPGHSKTKRHAQCNALANRWRAFRAGRAEAWRREAAAIEAEHAQPRLVRAERGVVLATGGFIFNREMLKANAPSYTRTWKNGHAGCDGSGIRLGQSVGGDVARMDNVSAWRFITPPSCWPQGVVVNSRGERFCNEQVYGATLGHEMMQNQGGKAWLVIDANLRKKALRECVFGGLWAFQALPALALMLFGAKKAGSVEELARRIGAEPAVLRATVASANAAARGEGMDAMGKSADMRAVLGQPPFYALDISARAPMFPMASITLGGLRVDENTGHVQDGQGRAIAGLLAAGRAAIGVASGRYVSGLSLADCVFSGRRAGAAAAQREF